MLSLTVIGRRILALAAVVVAVLALPALGGARPAAANVPFVDIASAGPLTHIFIGNELSCQVAHEGDSVYELYPSNTAPGDCGTFVAVGGTLYAPDFGAHDVSATSALGTYTPFTPVSQSAVTGTGSAVDPFKVVTVVTAGNSGLTITETDSYVVGEERYRTDVEINNQGEGTASMIVYRGGDCYLVGSDDGYGFADPATKTVACTQNPNNSPPGRIEEWSPITPVDHYMEAHYSTIWAAIGSQTDLPDTCNCNNLDDNGAAINWDRAVPFDTSVTLSHYTTFSPTGGMTPTPTVQASATPSVRLTATPTMTATVPASPTPEASATPLPPTSVPPTNTPTGGQEGTGIRPPSTGSGGTGNGTPIVPYAGAAAAIGLALLGAAGMRLRKR